MPKIRQLIAETSAGGTAPSRMAGEADFASGLGNDGIGVLGAGVQRSAGMLEEMVTRDDVANVRQAMAKARADWTVAFQQRANEAKPGDPTFAAKFNQDFQDYVQKGRDVATTVAGQRTYDSLAAEIGGHFSEKAGLFQIASAGEKAKIDFQKEANSYGNALLSDPTQYQAVLKQALDGLNDPQGAYANIPAAAREKLALGMTQHLTKNYFQGLINNGAPELAKKQLMDGKMDAGLTPEDKESLIKSSDVGIRAKDTAAERQRMMDERARKDAVEAGMNSFLTRIVSPSKDSPMPSDKEILASDLLDSAHKQHLIDYKMRRARELAANHEARTNPGEVRKLMLGIHAASNDPTKTYNDDAVMASYRAGKISTNEMTFLRREVFDMKNGATQGFAKDVAQANNLVHTTFTRSIEGSVQPEMAVDAAYRFQMDLQAKIEAKRKANEDPRVLLDPTSKEYALSPGLLRSYLTPLRSSVAGAAARKAAGAPEDTGSRESAGRINGGGGTAPTYPEAINPKTGERQIYKDGKWQKP